MDSLLVLRTLLLVSAGVLPLAAACSSKPAPEQVPLHAVLDCEGAYEGNAIFPAAHTLQDGGHTIESLAAGNFGPDSGPAFADANARLRAAVVCSCRAERNRHRAATAAAWADFLTVFGGTGTVVGGVIDGTAATGVDDTTRKTLLTAGLITTGVGVLAFGINLGLNLTGRATALDRAAADQEYASAVLWNDSATVDQWSRAWSACVTGEGSDRAMRLDDPSSAFRDGGNSNTTTSSDAASGETDNDGGGRAKVEEMLRGFSSTAVPVAHQDAGVGAKAGHLDGGADGKASSK